MNGYGVWILEDGRSYEGEFENNVINGLGEFKWQDGRSYKGEYQNN